MINSRDFFLIGVGLSSMFFIGSFTTLYVMWSAHDQPVSDLIIGCLFCLAVSFGFGLKLGYDLQIPKGITEYSNGNVK